MSVHVDVASKRLATASDDRGVCFWRSEKPQLPWTHPEQSFTCVGPVFGHDARVWRAVFVRTGGEGEDGNELLVASVGEDSRVCLWECVTGSLRMKFVAHGGACIRSLACSKW
jgi:WD40 repeat protein